MYKNKKTGVFGIIITIIILVVLVIITNIGDKKVSYIESAFNSIIMPIQNGLTYLKNKLAGNNTFFEDINKLKEDNKELLAQNSELEKQLRELEIIKSENQTLKDYLNLSEKYQEYTTIPAEIINKDTNNYSNIIVINVGQKEGIQKDMVVISDKGLVGHVISVSNSTSKVQTIVDPANTVSSTISSSRDNIICRGTLEEKNTLKASFIPTDATLIQGDMIETSGLGGVYPKGIHVGTIKQIISTKNITDRYLIIETAVNFSRLETVLVIK